ncbi:unnamed protein product [Urochloa humidicola]
MLGPARFEETTPRGAGARRRRREVPARLPWPRRPDLAGAKSDPAGTSGRQASGLDALFILHSVGPTPSPSSSGRMCFSSAATRGRWRPPEMEIAAARASSAAGRREGDDLARSTSSRPFLHLAPAPPPLLGEDEDDELAGVRGQIWPELGETCMSGDGGSRNLSDRAGPLLQPSARGGRRWGRRCHGPPRRLDRGDDGDVGDEPPHACRGAPRRGPMGAVGAQSGRRRGRD